MGWNPRSIVFLLFGLITGCDRLLPEDTQGTSPPPLPPPPPKKAAPATQWEAKYGVKLTFEGKGFEKAKCDFTLVAIKGETALAISCAHLPHPYEVSFEGVKEERRGREEYDRFTFPGDFTKKLGGASLDALKDKLNVKLAMPIEVTFTFEGYEALKVSPPVVWTSDDVFKTWAGKPVHLGEGERPDDGKKSALLVHEGYSGHALVGEGTVLDDLDYIAVQRDLDEPSVACFGGRLVYRTEADVTLYDRRTGATIETKHFKNSRPGCPATAVVGPRTEYQSAVYDTAITPWLKTRIRK